MDKLPVEVISIIADFLVEDNQGDRIASYSTISAKWQQAIECWTFRRISIDSTQLDAVSHILSFHRRHHIRDLYYSITVPCDESDGHVNGNQRLYSDALSEALRKIFQLLAEKDDSVSDRSSMTLHLHEVPPNATHQRTYSGQPPPEYLTSDIDLVNFDKWPMAHCVSQLVLKEMPRRKLSLVTGFRLAARLPNLSSITLTSWEESPPLNPSWRTPVEEKRSALATVLADTYSLASSTLRDVDLRVDSINPRREFSDYLGPEWRHIWFQCEPPGAHDPLSITIRRWSRPLSTLTVRGMFAASLFWPAENEPPVSIDHEHDGCPRWPNLTKFTVQLSLFGPGDERYFKSWDDPRPKPADYVDFASPRRTQPDDSAIQPLLASWAKALAQMPVLLQASVFWNIPDCRGNDDHWAVSFLAPGTAPERRIHVSLDVWEGNITPEEARSPRLIVENMWHWLPWETTLDSIRETVEHRFPGTELVILGVDMDHKVTRANNGWTILQAMTSRGY
ncbi:carbohydrate-binding module family 50 protein [Apiospora arundinis]